MKFDLETILNAVAAATNFARTIATVVDEAKETFGQSDRVAVESALQKLQAENDRLHETVSAKLGAASQQG